MPRVRNKVTGLIQNVSMADGRLKDTANWEQEVANGQFAPWPSATAAPSTAGDKTSKPYGTGVPGIAAETPEQRRQRLLNMSREEVNTENLLDADAWTQMFRKKYTDNQGTIDGLNAGILAKLQAPTPTYDFASKIKPISNMPSLPSSMVNSFKQVSAAPTTPQPGAYAPTAASLATLADGLDWRKEGANLQKVMTDSAMGDIGAQLDALTSANRADMTARGLGGSSFDQSNAGKLAFARDRATQDAMAKATQARIAAQSGMIDQARSGALSAEGLRSAAAQSALSSWLAGENADLTRTSAFNDVVGRQAAQQGTEYNRAAGAATDAYNRDLGAATTAEAVNAANKQSDQQNMMQMIQLLLGQQGANAAMGAGGDLAQILAQMTSKNPQQKNDAGIWGSIASLIPAFL